MWIPSHVCSDTQHSSVFCRLLPSRSCPGKGLELSLQARSSAFQDLRVAFLRGETCCCRNKLCWAAGGAQRRNHLEPCELRSRPPKCVCWSVIILIEDNYESLTVCSLLTVVFPVCLKLRPLLTTHWILVYMFGLFSFHIVVFIV